MERSIHEKINFRSWFNGKLRITKNPLNSDSEYTRSRLSQPFYLYPDHSKDNKHRMFKFKF